MLILIGSNGGLGSGIISFLEKNPKLMEPYGELYRATRKDVELEDFSSVTNFFSKIQTMLSPSEPLYLINAAGISLNGMIHKLDLNNWKKTVQVNLDSSFYLLKAVQPILSTRTESSVLFLGSIVSELGVPGTSAYASTKAGLHGLVKTASKEFARFNSRINCIDLGYFDRGMISQLPSELLSKTIDQIPLKRLGSSEDLFRACDFALRCAYLTGAVIPLNGGLS